ncbi:MAG: radical SAM protein [Desulfosarcinaceae bacterium]|nr:radical SAM protein [Desulfosarcinaceae bacterium]
MQYEGTTYRPPPEADTPLLQVTVGCAHNRCTFCDMYRDVRFRQIPLDQVEADLKELRCIFPSAERIFLVNGDAFVLKTSALKKIAALIHRIFPECQTISMYASIRDIKAKRDEELGELKDLGVNDLYVGIESGWDMVLERINKGHSAADAKEQLERLNRIGIHHIANLMLGVAGMGNGIENARHTAKLLNQTQPSLIWVGTLAIFEGTALHMEMEQGSFLPATELEILAEEKALIDAITLENVRFYGVHPTNTVRVSGTLPQDRRAMLAAIDAGIEKVGVETLSAAFARSSL